MNYGERQEQALKLLQVLKATPDRVYPCRCSKRCTFGDMAKEVESMTPFGDSLVTTSHIFFQDIGV